MTAISAHSVRRSLPALSGQTGYILLLFGVTALLMPLSRFVSPSLGSWSTVSAILVISSMLVLVGFGQGLVILVGELDLSIASVIALTGVLTTAWLGESPSLVTFLEILAIAVLIGVLNGIGVTVLKVPSFIMTLGSQLIVAGIALGYTKGTVPGTTPRFLGDLMLGKVLGVPTPILLLIGIAVVGFVIQRYTVFGRRLYAVGGNRATAAIAGVHVNRMIVGAFAVSSLCAALTGMLLVGYGGGATLGMGDGYFLPSIAVVVVGGSSILGGRGNYLGTVAATIFLQTISTLIQALGISQGWQTFIYGCLIIAVVGLLKRDLATKAGRLLTRPGKS
ncbi:ABC transporter permease [Actinomadura formosensis]|uniref:ABC transporter permease n=1 Tax=Actinomadura formosensis TaxID=60706 RepID=UPI0008372435|nr:ABC transporter permease [Actinomadura formosensis]